MLGVKCIHLATATFYFITFCKCFIKKIRRTFIASTYQTKKTTGTFSSTSQYQHGCHGTEACCPHYTRVPTSGNCYQPNSTVSHQSTATDTKYMFGCLEFNGTFNIIQVILHICVTIYPINLFDL